MSDSFNNQPLVIDNGSGAIKAGFAGADAPKANFSNYIGRPKHRPSMVNTDMDRDYFIGPQAVKLRGLLKIHYPVEHGVVLDWTEMTRIWKYTFDTLGVVQDEHPVLITEAPLNPKKNRAKTAEVFFDSFNVPALYVAAQAILALYASGRTTGIVLDSGDGVTHAVPVVEGFAIPHAITRIDVAGRDVTNHLQLLLRRNGHVFHTSAEMEVVKSIKESICYVPFNVEASEKEEKDDTQPLFELPDGQVIKIGAEKFRAAEVLFQPSLIGLEYQGVHQMLCQSIAKCDLDLRRTLFSEIVLSGGSTLFTGFGDRLLYEVRKIAPRDTKVRIFAPQERILSTWLGGSILASLTSFKSMWVTRAEYHEHGKSIVYRKTF